MTQEEKELLLKDLCSRLFCGVMIQHPDLFYPSRMVVEKLVSIDRGHINDDGVSVEFVKPYLRSMSRMTKKEKSMYLSYCQCADGDYTGEILYFDTIESFDYLNQIHIDYRNLIPRGLALEAPKNMYNNKLK